MSSSSTAPAAPHVSWLSKVGSFLGKILGFVDTKAKPIADTAAAVATALFPQFAPEIAAADNLVTKIALQATAVESVAASAGKATGTGAQKLASVVESIGPAIDQWVANAFPGAKQVSSANKAGLVNAVVAIMNDIEPPAAIPAP